MHTFPVVPSRSLGSRATGIVSHPIEMECSGAVHIVIVLLDRLCVGCFIRQVVAADGSRISRIVAGLIYHITWMIK